MKKIKFNPLRPQQMEKLLMQQHRNGHAVKEISPFTGKMVFVPCKPEDVAYRLDFYQAPNTWIGSSHPECDHHYRGIFEDMGWELVCVSLPYVVFRKPAEVASREEELELYSDRASLEQYQKRILLFQFSKSIVFLILGIGPMNVLTISSWKWPRFVWVILIVLCWSAYVGYFTWQFHQARKEEA